VTLRRGGIGNVIALMVIITLLLAAVVLMVNVLSRQVAVSQRTVEAVQKQQLASEVVARVSACYAVVKDPLAGYLLAVKTNNIPAFCQYVKAIQSVMTINGLNTSAMFSQELWTSGSSLVVYSACTNNYKPKYVTYGGLRIPAALLLYLAPGDYEVGVYKVQMLLDRIGWKAIPNCFQTTGGSVQITTIQQTTTIFSIGPITVLASGGVNPLQYICPPPRAVVGDDYAYEIAMVLNPHFNGTRNNVPTSVVLNLKDIIERSAPTSSPLRYYIDDVYIRNITVMRVATTPSIYQVSWSSSTYLPWSFTFLNLTSAQTPLQNSSGVLTFNFTAPAPMTPNSLVQYSAVVCLYLGIKGQYPPGSQGHPFDGLIFSEGEDVTPPGSAYPCYSFSGYDVCYVPPANLTTTYARNVTSSAGMKFVGLQYPTDASVRTYKIIIENPNDVPLYNQVVRVKLPPELNGTAISIVDQFGGSVKFCYETVLGNCTSAPVKGGVPGQLNVSSGYVWVKVPYLPPGDQATLTVLAGTNGASSPYEVFPVYVDFANARIEVDSFGWTWNFPGYAFTQSAAVFQDPNNALNFVSKGWSFSVAAVVRWDGAFNFNQEDELNYYIDPTWRDGSTTPGFGWGGGAALYAGYWLYPIAYQVDPASGTGWMLAVYRGAPVILEIDDSGGAIYLRAQASQTMVPGLKYLIVAGYDNTTGSWEIYLKPLETLEGEAPTLPETTVGNVLLEEINQYLGTTNLYSLMYELFNAATASFVISDASRYYDPQLTLALGTRSETMSSFSGVIYNVTVFNNYQPPSVIEQCLNSYDPNVCPAVYAHTSRPDGYGLKAWVTGAGTEYATIYSLWWYAGTTSITFVDLTDWSQVTINTANPGFCLPLVGAINITVVKGVNVVKGTVYGAPLNGGSTAYYCTPLWTAAGTIEKGIVGKNSIVLNTTWLGQSVAWNFWFSPEVPKGTYYEVRVGMNGGSYGYYGGTTTTGPPWASVTTYNWAVFYPYVPSIVGDGRSWLKWMIYEDNDALYRFITSRNGFWGDAWRVYLVPYASEPVPAVTDPEEHYYNIIKYDLGAPAVYFNVYEGGPLGTIFYYGTIDLSGYKIGTSYTQLLPKQVEYIGFSYMDADNTTTIGQIGTDTRRFYFMFARTLPRVPLEDYVQVQVPDLYSPKIDAPIVYMKRKGYTVINVTGPYNATMTFDVLGNVSARLSFNPYGAYSNATGPYYGLSSFYTNVTVAPFWNSGLSWEGYAEALNMPVSDVNKWTVVAFNKVAEVLSTGATNYYNNFTLAYMPETGDYVFTYNNVTQELNGVSFVIGLSNTLGAVELYANVTPPLVVLAKGAVPVDGVLSWAKLGYDVSNLDKTSIIMINKRNWYVTISGPYCIKCT